MKQAIAAAVEAIGRARHLLITAGAGMGVDSGLPDFRGNEGFWNAYPPYRARGRPSIVSALDCDPDRMDASSNVLASVARGRCVVL